METLTKEQTFKLFQTMRDLEDMLVEYGARDALVSVETVGDSFRVLLDSDKVFSEWLRAHLDLEDTDTVKLLRDGTVELWKGL